MEFQNYRAKINRRANQKEKNTWVSPDHTELGGKGNTWRGVKSYGLPHFAVKTHSFRVGGRMDDRI